MIKEILQNIPVIVVTGIAAVAGGTAVTNLTAEYLPLSANKPAEIREAKKGSVNDDTLVVTETPAVSPSAATIVPTVVATTGQFTLATLAQHNKPGNCYVAYKTVVYNVSSHPSWGSCTHHGIGGGRDITSQFPHATSYFNALPKMGTLAGGSTVAKPTNRVDDDDNDDNEREDEREESENEDEHESEDD